MKLNIVVHFGADHILFEIIDPTNISRVRKHMDFLIIVNCIIGFISDTFQHLIQPNYILFYFLPAVGNKSESLIFLIPEQLVIIIFGFIRI